MKSKLNLASALIVLLGSTAIYAFAADNELLGEAAPPTAATRTVVIDHDTQYVNVTGGDIVKFVVHNKEYVWNFDGADTNNFVDLNKIFPNDGLHHEVKVYIARNPLYTGA
jgi:hypothetical protein